MIWTKGAKFQTFVCSREMSPNFYLNRLLLLKVYKISAKKNLKELCLMTLKGDTKFEEKMTCVLENDMRNLVNFYQSTQKPQIWDFDGILLSKVGNV